MIELTYDQIRELQNIEIIMLSHFTRLCDQLGLKYYIVAGTLLGAVRHQGFIPWDDDIDIAMPRADYEHLLRHGQQHLPSELFLQSFHNEPDFPANFCKLRNSNTTFVEASIANKKVNHGVYLDIFPLDFYPTSGRLLYNVKYKLQSIRITDAFTPSSGMKHITKFVRLFTRLIYPSITDAVLARENNINIPQPKGKTMLINNCNRYRERDIFPIEWYGEGIKLTFEGLSVNAPTYYHQWLTQIYGDYMQPPPPEKCIPHHYVSAFDLEKPYTYYCK